MSKKKKYYLILLDSKQNNWSNPHTESWFEITFPFFGIMKQGQMEHINTPFHTVYFPLQHGAFIFGVWKRFFIDFDFGLYFLFILPLRWKKWNILGMILHAIPKHITYDFEQAILDSIFLDSFIIYNRLFAHQKTQTLWEENSNYHIVWSESSHYIDNILDSTPSYGHCIPL